MFRSMCLTVGGLFLCASLAAAEEVRCTVKKVDTTKNSITCMVAGKEMTYTLATGVQIQGYQSRLLRRDVLVTYSSLTAIVPENSATLTLDKGMVTRVQLEGTTTTGMRRFGGRFALLR